MHIINRLEHNKLDIILIEKETKTSYVPMLRVHFDTRMVSKERERFIIIMT